MAGVLGARGRSYLARARLIVFLNKCLQRKSFSLRFKHCLSLKVIVLCGCLPLPQILGNSCWDANGKRFVGSSHWKIPGTNGHSKKVVPFSQLGRSAWKFVYHLQVS